MSALLDVIEKHDAKDVIVTNSGCAGLCSREPMATVELRGSSPIKYVDLTEEKIREYSTNMYWEKKLLKSMPLGLEAREWLKPVVIEKFSPVNEGSRIGGDWLLFRYGILIFVEGGSFQ